MSKELTPYPYQEVGTEWLETKGLALLGDGMGLGKTAQLIRAFDKLNLRRIIIVCPSIARLTWEREIKLWSLVPNRKIRILTKRSEVPHPGDEILICSFDYATNRYRDLNKEDRALLIVDESHYLKSLEAQRTLAVFGKEGIIRSCKRTWLATGTPMPNHPGELYATLYTFGITQLNYDQYVEKYCDFYMHNGRRNITGTKAGMLPELKVMLSKIMLRRLVKDVLKDLPTARVTELPVEAELESLTPELKEQFDALEAFLGRLDTNLSPLEQLGMLEATATSIASLRRYCAMSKVKPICDLVASELDHKAYNKILIFGIHREALDEITERLKGYGCVAIHGGTSAKQRQANIDRFQKDPKCQAFALNIQAAGTNITLTETDEILFLEQSFTPGDNSQCVARAVRIGQKKSVHVRIASLANSVDEKVQKILTVKLKDILELLG